MHLASRRSVIKTLGVAAGAAFVAPDLGAQQGQRDRAPRPP